MYAFGSNQSSWLSTQQQQQQHQQAHTAQHQQVQQQHYQQHAQLQAHEDPHSQSNVAPSQMQAKQAASRAPQAAGETATGSSSAPSREKRAEILRSIKALPPAKIVPPKNPPSAFLIYANSVREQLLNTFEIQSLPKADRIRRVMAIAGERWRNMTPNQKYEYEERHRVAKEQYNRSHAEYLKQRTTEDIVLEEKRRALKKRLNPNKALRRVDKDPDEPEKPKNAYMLFFIDVASGKMTTLQGDVFSQQMNQTDRLKAIAETWKSMSDEQKAPYVQQAKILKQEYDEKYQEYLQSSGRQDFVDTVNVLMRKEKKKKIIPIVPVNPAASAAAASLVAHTQTAAASGSSKKKQPAKAVPAILNPSMAPTGLNPQMMGTMGQMPMFGMGLMGGGLTAMGQQQAQQQQHQQYLHHQQVLHQPHHQQQQQQQQQHHQGLPLPRQQPQQKGRGAAAAAAAAAAAQQQQQQANGMMLQGQHHLHMQQQGMQAMGPLHRW
ncbi:hypothetical protein DFJ73DRAFT_407455 [Zopfochytrium polystomum]|nr:hypothetical protein DFJ73DRAFT_407455 [Zopfochytrium polystomum]